MRLLSSSLCGQLIVREVRGNTEVEISQPCSHLIPFNFSGSYPSTSPLAAVSPGLSVWSAWQLPSPDSQRHSSQRWLPPGTDQDTGPHSPSRVASGDPSLQKHRQEAEDRGSRLLSLTQASLTDRAEGRGSDTAWDRKPRTSTQCQSPTHPTDQRRRFWRITSGRWEN